MTVALSYVCDNFIGWKVHSFYLSARVTQYL